MFEYGESHFSVTTSSIKSYGYYKIGKGSHTLHVSIGTKPILFHRIMTRILLGWEWIYNK